MPVRSVEIYVGQNGLLRLREEWTSLERAVASPFYTRYQWCLAVAQTLLGGSDEILFAKLVHAGRECRGIVPLFPETRKLGPFRVCTLGAPLRDHIDLTDVLLADGESFSNWIAPIRKALRRSNRRCALWRFPSTPADGALLRNSSARNSPMLYYAPRHSCIIDCSGSYNEVKESYSSRLRKTMKRATKGLEALGALRLKSFSSGKDRSQALAAFYELEASGWKGGDGTSTAILFHQNAKAFYGMLYLSDDFDDVAEINLLMAGERIVAGQLCMVVGDTRSLLKIAFDQDLQKFSPGTVMLDRQIERTCNETRVAKINLVTGSPWMEDWRPRRVQVGDVWVLPSRLSAWVGRAGAGIYEALRRGKTSGMAGRAGRRDP